MGKGYMMDEDDAGMLRYIFQHKISLHPKWNRDKCDALMALFDLDDEEMIALYRLATWINNHGLEHHYEYKKELYG